MGVLMGMLFLMFSLTMYGNMVAGNTTNGTHHECPHKFEAASWRGVTGSVVMSCVYIAAFLLNSLAIVASVLCTELRKHLVVQLFVTLFLSHLITLSANLAAALTHITTSVPLSCATKTWTFFFNRLGSTESSLLLAFVPYFHLKMLKSRSINNDSMKSRKRKLVLLYQIFSWMFSVMVVSAMLIVTSVNLIFLSVVISFTCYILAIIFCYRIWKMPMWRNTNCLYMRSIRGMEYGILGTIVGAVCPEIFLLVVHTIRKLGMAPKSNLILLWIAQMSNLSLFLKPLVYFASRKDARNALSNLFRAATRKHRAVTVTSTSEVATVVNSEVGTGKTNFNRHSQQNHPKSFLDEGAAVDPAPSNVQCFQTLAITVWSKDQ